jgi:hypothetical protein
MLAFWTTDNNGNYLSNISGLVSANSSISESMEMTFGQDFNGDGVIGPPSSTSGSGVVANISSSAQAAAITAARASFSDSTSIATASSNINGQIVGLGNGDQIHLHDAAQTNFHFANDGDGGLPVTSPAPSAQGAATTNPAATEAGHDTFVFASNFGQASSANFSPSADNIVFKNVFASLEAAVAAIHNDPAGNAVVTDAAHDTIAPQHVTTAQLFAHLADFHIL